MRIIRGNVWWMLWGTIMLDFIEYNPTEEDLDKIRLAVIRLLFDKDLTLASGVCE